MKFLDKYRKGGALEYKGGDPTKPYHPVNNPDGYKTQATRQDSLDVANQARRTLSYYQNPKFGYDMKKTEIGDFYLGELKNFYTEDNNLYNTEENINRFKSKTLDVSMYPEWAKVNNIKNEDIPALGTKAEYYLSKRTKDKYPIWDMITGALDFAAPPILYDRRISPQALWQGLNPDSPGVAVTIPYYDPIAVMPQDLLTDEQLKKRIQKYGNSGIPESRIKKVMGEVPVATNQSVSSNNYSLSKSSSFETPIRKPLTPLQNSIEPIGLNTTNYEPTLMPDNLPRVPLNTTKPAYGRDFYQAAEVLANQGKPVGRVYDGDTWTELGSSDWNKLYGTKLPEKKAHGGWLNTYEDGGPIQPPSDWRQFSRFNKSLPDNLRNNKYRYNQGIYDLYGMWEASGKPNNFSEVKDTDYFPLQDDGTYHGFSVGNEGVWLKSKNHPTAWKEYAGGALSPELANQTVIQREDGKLQYVPKKQMGGWLNNY